MSELRWYLLLIGAVILLWIWYSGRRQNRAGNHNILTDVEHGDGLPQDTQRYVAEENPRKTSEAALAEINAADGQAEVSAVDGEIATDEADSSVSEETVEPETEFEHRDPVLPDEVGDEIVIESVENEPVAFANEEAAPAEAEETTEEPLQLVMLYVMASEDKPFPGEAVLKAFHVHKLRFGDLDIFHRETPTAEGRQTIFSVSNMFKPGTLIPDDLKHSDVLGLGFFMQVPGPIDPLDAFKDMLHTAQHLASALDGELCDETLTPLNQDTITEIRRRLLESSDG